MRPGILAGGVVCGLAAVNRANRGQPGPGYELSGYELSAGYEAMTLAPPTMLSAHFPRDSRVIISSTFAHVQGYLAHKQQHPPRALQYA